MNTGASNNGMDDETKYKIVERMSLLSNTFKVLSGTALIGAETYNIWFIAPIFLFAIMDLYYFYKEKLYRDINMNKGKAILEALLSFSFWGYYSGIVLIVIIMICKGVI